MLKMLMNPVHGLHMMGRRSGEDAWLAELLTSDRITRLPIIFSGVVVPTEALR